MATSGYTIQRVFLNKKKTKDIFKDIFQEEIIQNETFQKTLTDCANKQYNKSDSISM